MLPPQLPQPSQKSRYVFVYGTLRSGQERDVNLLLPAPLWVGYGSVHGLLYDLGAYPGLVSTRERSAQKIHGEIYAITSRLEELLDEIEEVWPQQTGEYSKLEVDVELETDAQLPAAGGRAGRKKELRCLVYEIHASRVQGMVLISSGDWVLHRASKQN